MLKLAKLIMRFGAALITASIVIGVHAIAGRVTGIQQLVIAIPLCMAFGFAVVMVVMSFTLGKDGTPRTKQLSKSPAHEPVRAKAAALTNPCDLPGCTFVAEYGHKYCGMHEQYFEEEKNL